MNREVSMSNVAAVLMLLLAACSGAPETIERIEIINPTDYDLGVEVSGDRHLWLPLALVDKRSSATVREVIDQGERWTFRFRYFGDSLGEVSLSRTQLESAGWRLEIPSEVGERIAQVGSIPVQ
jgi:hypothetical protein